jgi:hypothetical protein
LFTLGNKKIQKNGQIIRATIFHGESYALCIFDKNMGWATFWTAFSQTHLVTLLRICTGYSSTLKINPKSNDPFSAFFLQGSQLRH